MGKKSGSIRPIAVGYTIRRLVAKCANKFAISKMVSSLCPRQLGVGVPGGCEAAIHATRRFIDSMQAGSVVAKLDFSNAFNCLHRDSMLQAVTDKIPELYNFCHLSYSCTSFLSLVPTPFYHRRVPSRATLWDLSCFALPFNHFWIRCRPIFQLVFWTISLSVVMKRWLRMMSMQ